MNVKGRHQPNRGGLVAILGQAGQIIRPYLLILAIGAYLAILGLFAYMAIWMIRVFYW